MMGLSRDHGVTHVLCLQTDEDLSSRGLQWGVLWQLYLRLGVDVTRVPIVDFDKKDLLSHLDQAVAALHAALEGGGKVYVHCSAGLNRSPTVIIAYLIQHRGMSLDEAMAWVLAMQARRTSPIAQARSRDAMAKMLGKRRR